jgi:hypothetical protein
LYARKRKLKRYGVTRPVDLHMEKGTAPIGAGFPVLKMLIGVRTEFNRCLDACIADGPELADLLFLLDSPPLLSSLFFTELKMT